VQAELKSEGEAHMAALNAMSDAEWADLCESAMPKMPGPMRAEVATGGVDAFRKLMIALHKDGAQGAPAERLRDNDADAACRLCLDVGKARAAVRLWRDHRRLSLPPRRRRGGRRHARRRAQAGNGGGGAGDDLEWHVNPMAWPCVPPFGERHGRGMRPPWKLLYCAVTSDEFRDVQRPRNGSAPGNVAELVFGRAAAALRRLAGAGALEVTLDCGDVLTLPRRGVAAGGAGDMPLEFDRIHLNSVPDRVSLLPVLTELAPCLKARPDAWLTHNVLLATPLYTDAQHYVHAHTLLPSGRPITAMLLGVENIWGSLWSGDICWRRACGAPRLDGTLTPPALSAWLRAVAAGTALPPVRRNASFAHHLPATLAVFMRVVERVAARVPPHWLASALHPLLGRDDARRAVLVPHVPSNGVQPVRPAIGWPVSTARQAAWNLGVAGAELDAMSALWAPRLPAALLAPAVAAADAAGAGGALCLLELGVELESTFSLFHDFECTQSHTLGLLLLSASEDRRRAREAGCLPLNIRDLSYHNGAAGGGAVCTQLLSAVRFVPGRARWNRCGGEATWRAAPPRLQFWLREARLQGMLRGEWKAHVVSTDTWQVVTRTASALRDVRVVRRLRVASGGL
jgi:hypothetical protein